MWKQDIKLLIITAKADAAKTINRLLSQDQIAGKAKVHFRTEVATSAASATEQLNHATYDVVILDARSASGDKFEQLVGIRKQALETPIITLVGSANDDNVPLAEAAGADECLDSASLALIPQAARFMAGRRHAEKHCSRIEEEFQMLIQHSADITVLLDSQARIHYISPSVETTLGYKPSELNGLCGLDFTHPEDVKFSKRRLQEALANPKTRVISDIRFRHKNGAWVPLEVACTAAPDRDGAMRLVCNARDISARWHAEESSRQSEEQFRTIFENLPDATFVEDLNGRVLDVNAAACRLHGMSRDKIIGKCVLELTPPGEHESVLRNFPKIFSGQIKTLEGESLSTDGRVIPTELTVSRILYAGQPAVLLNVRDISDRKNAEAIRQKLEDGLRQMQKLDSISQLSASIAHDFNKIIAVVQGHVDLLLKNPDLSPVAQESTQQISQAAERASRLTHQLLSFSRMQDVEFDSVDLNEVVRIFSRMLERVLGADISLRYEPAPSPVCIQGDAGMIEQILLNLILNARDATDPGGSVTVKVEPARPDNNHLLPLNQSSLCDYTCLSVTDTGRGIPADVLPRIFEPFFTTKAKERNTGFGLSTVYRIVKQHNGWVDVSSTPGEGSAFKIYLPAIKPDTAQKPDGEALVTIIVLESDPDIRENASSALRQEGFRVLEASSNMEALELSIRQSPKTDLIITNPDLFDSSNGHDVIEGFRSGNPGLKVILINSAKHQPGGPSERQKHRLPAHASSLAKPFDSHKLCDAVHATLHIR